MRPLSRTLSGARLQRTLQAKGLTRNPVCPDCEEAVEPSAWAMHRNQLCRGKKKAAPDRESETA